MRDPTKEFLMSARWSHAEALRLSEKVTSLTTQVEHITASYSGMPSAHNGDSSAAWTALAQLRDEYAAKLVEAERNEKAVSDFVDHIPTPECREILQLRYCRFRKWTQIASDMEKAGYYFSERQVFRIHGKALNEARVLFNQEIEKALEVEQ